LQEDGWKMKKTILYVLVFIFTSMAISNISYPEEKMKSGEKSQTELNDPEAILNSLSWLAGHWEGEAFGGICEEVWAPASAGSMVGTFKLIKDGKVIFYEIEIITADSAGFALKLKHFNSDLTGWEEKDEVIRFDFISAREGGIKFKGLSFRKVSEDSLLIVLDTKDKDGNIRENAINCGRLDR
jgi:hypothetical protein